MYVKLENDAGYFNLANALVVDAYLDGSDWKVRINQSASYTVDGVAETSEANALDAARRLVHGVTANSVI